MSKLTDAFRELTQVCRVRPGVGESDISAMARRILNALGEYPEPVALAALDLWPRRSNWFPTEYELRELLEEVATEARIGAMEREHVGGGRYNAPVGATVQFVDRVRQIRGEAYVKSWLRGGVTAQFSGTTVYTTRIGEERLMKDVGPYAAHFNVTIKHDPDVSKMLADYCERNGLTFSEPKRRR